MKIRKSEFVKGSYEIVNQDTRLFVGGLEELENLVGEIESFLEEESQRTMLENYKMEDL
jgi:hypothetical protein